MLRNPSCCVPQSRLAYAMAALLLLAQCVSAAHFHRKDLSQSAIQSAQSADANCALCLLHFHSPCNSGPASPAIGPGFTPKPLVEVSTWRRVSWQWASSLSRAPPIPL